MVDYKVLVSDTSTGKPLAQIPLTFTSPYSRVLNGVGSCTGTVPLDHPNCTPANLDGDREISIYRDGVFDWNGPITRLRPQRSTNVLEITAREPTWILSRRTLEVDKHWNADIFYIVRSLFIYATGKQSNGQLSGGTSINAAVPRFFVTPTTNAGIVRQFYWSGTARRYILDLINEVVADPTSGLDYKMVYQSTTRQLPNRTMTFGSPSLGAVRKQVLTEKVLVDYGYDADRDRAGNRVHTTGSGYTYTLQNSGSVAAGDSLVEQVFDRSDTSNHTVIQSFTSDARRAAQPPVRTYAVTFKPGPALPHDWCDLGDTVSLAISGPPMLALSATRRVMEIAKTPQSDSGDETVSLTFNLPLDQLGT